MVRHTLTLVVAMLAAFVLAAVAWPASSSVARLQRHERQQVRLVEQAKTTLRFFERHASLLYAKDARTKRRAWHAVAVARSRIIRGRQAIAWTRAEMARLTPRPFAVPDWFMARALCVHDGWWHQGHAPFARTADVPDGIPGGSGEANWANRSSYRGGMQFAWSTWQRAGGSGDPADATPAEQVYRAYVIVVNQDGGSWREWPQTARACGLL